ncbi:MAG: NAD(P)/FAD-dependent oxidoreductase, partial [Verrucomicrobiota bacterium]|nr:NAD(P)/FAD-dependent oxidoreductase [Verrucomicrobiota bacterium]
MPTVVVVGGGPAGLRAAEVARADGADVLLCDAQPSVGRKFLVAGRGGLNLTHSERVENFPQRYRAEQERWRELLAEFGPRDLEQWAEQLGIETYRGTSGRVFPRGQKAAVLLRAWIQRLRAAGVAFRMNTRLTELERNDDSWRAEFQQSDDTFRVHADAVVLALGGASWPETGSDGTWPAILARLGIPAARWVPANCGWEVDWPTELLARAEGLPLKNLTATANSESVSGELLITRYGLEGGAIYRLGPLLRDMQPPVIVLDLKPQLSPEALHARLAN